MEHPSLHKLPIRLILSFFLTFAGRSAFADLTGKEIYEQKCSGCHGASGQGSKEFPRPLVGTRSVAQLAKLIAKTMPEDDPGTCVGVDADKVASFIHEAFYYKNDEPPRIELSRLTVRQYKQVVTDLIGSFRGNSGEWGAERGLKGEYFKSRGYRDRGIERVDPELKFDFGIDGPDPQTFQANAFSIKWSGSVIASETGDYEFIIKTEHSMRFWVNDQQKPLIDALVKSGDDKEYKGSIYLLGGRAYPVRLEFAKSKQGVDDSKTFIGPPKPVPASISLSWKPPHGTSEVIPSRNLIPRSTPELFVATTPFPPDDRSVGYERGTSVSKAWDQATTDGAIEVAGYVASHLQQLAGTRDDLAKLRDFSTKFVERAFRSPLSDEQKQKYVGRQFETAKSPEAAIKRVILMALKSPRFLYREVAEIPPAYEVASRVSFALWDSMPDDQLFKAASENKLVTRAQVQTQAERMLTDPRTKAKVREFFLHWLRVDAAPELSKDSSSYADFTPEITNDMRASLELMLDELIWSEASDFRSLLTSDELYLNGRLAKFLGAPLADDSPFKKTKLEPAERSGVLTHPYLMATFAYTSTTSPIHRGVFISRSVLGRSLKPPPEAVAPLAPDLHAGLTTRERTVLQTSPAACMTCHGMINPLGFSLERFDTVGRLRETEKGKPIDATGQFESKGGESIPYNGARELGKILVESDETHQAFVEQFFHALVQQPMRAFGENQLEETKKSFITNQFNIRKLMVEIVANTALTSRTAGTAVTQTP